MKVSNVFVVGVVCAFASGCSQIPNKFVDRMHQSPAKDLFVDDISEPDGAVTTVAGGSTQEAGLRIRKSDRGNMESYVVRGERYFTLDDADGYSARGVASWYGPNFHGRTASNGEVYDMYRLTAAHKTLPLPTYARVTHLENGRTVMVKINDRGPFSGDRIIDLSFAAALRLGMVNDGTAMVDIQVLSPEELMVLSGPENKLGIDFYQVGADGAEIAATETLSEVEVLAAATPEQLDSVSQEEITVSAAETNSQPLVAESITAEPITTDVVNTTAIEVVVPAVSAEQDIDNSVLPVVADAAGVTAIPASAAVQTVKAPATQNNAGYYIQAGVFADVADAERLAVDVVLAAPGEEVHVKPLKDSHMYRITVGPIVASEHASKVSSMLDTAGLDNFTVRVK